MKVQLQESQQQMVIPRVSPSTTTGGHQKTPEDSRKLIQKQLVLLLHAHACQKKDIIVDGNSPETQPRCPVPNCQMMKDVWVHIKACQIGPDCSHLHCLSSLKILAHWKHCKTVECPVCHLVRMKYRQSAAARRDAATNNSGAQIGLGVQQQQQQQSQFDQTAGQSTREQTQGQSQCQGQLQTQPQQNQQGSEFNESCHYNYPPRHQQNYYSSPTTSHENTCHVQPIQQQKQQIQQPSLSMSQSQSHVQQPAAAAALDEYVKSLLNSNDDTHDTTFKEYHHHSTVIVQPRQGQRMMPPSVSTAVNNVSPTKEDHMNLKYCRCEKCHQSSQSSDNSIPVNFNIPKQPEENENSSMMRSPQPELEQQPNEESNEDSTAKPSANDVRRAYEQLGIPCPPNALKRLMATLPGGSKETENNGMGQEGCRYDQEVPCSSEEDDGINVEYTTQDDDKIGSYTANWCLSLVKRLVANGGQRHQISANSSTP